MPNLADIKKNMMIPPANEKSADDNDKVVDALLKSATAVTGNSGSTGGADMTDSDQICYGARYTDLGAKSGKEHFKLIGNE